MTFNTTILIFLLSCLLFCCYGQGSTWITTLTTNFSSNASESTSMETSPKPTTIITTTTVETPTLTHNLSTENVTIGNTTMNITTDLFNITTLKTSTVGSTWITTLTTNFSSNASESTSMETSPKPTTNITTTTVETPTLTPNLSTENVTIGNTTMKITTDLFNITTMKTSTVGSTWITTLTTIFSTNASDSTSMETTPKPTTNISTTTVETLTPNSTESVTTAATTTNKSTDLPNNATQEASTVAEGVLSTVFEGTATTLNSGPAFPTSKISTSLTTSFLATPSGLTNMETATLKTTAIPTTLDTSTNITEVSSPIKELTSAIETTTNLTTKPSTKELTTEIETTTDLTTKTTKEFTTATETTTDFTTKSSTGIETMTDLTTKSSTKELTTEIETTTELTTKSSTKEITTETETTTDFIAKSSTMKFTTATETATDFTTKPSTGIETTTDLTTESSTKELTTETETTTDLTTKSSTKEITTEIETTTDFIAKSSTMELTTATETATDVTTKPSTEIETMTDLTTKSSTKEFTTARETATDFINITTARSSTTGPSWRTTQKTTGLQTSVHDTTPFLTTYFSTNALESTTMETSLKPTTNILKTTLETPSLTSNSSKENATTGRTTMNITTDLHDITTQKISTAVFTCNRPSSAGVPLFLQPDKTRYNVGEVVTYSCSRGYNLNGPENSTCESQDSWNPSGVPECLSGFVRRFVLSHLAASTQPVRYHLGYMDTDLFNTSVVRVITTTGDVFEDFYSGTDNYFDYSFEEFGYELSGRPSLEIQTTDSIYLYILPSQYKQQILCHPIDSLGTDYLLIPCRKSSDFSFLITATKEDTEISIFLPYDFEQDGTVYNFDKALRITLYELQTVVVNVSFVSAVPYIKSTEPVSVMVEHHAESTYSYGECLCSFYLPPIKHWGVHHSVPISKNCHNFSLTMTAAYNNTEVELSGYHQNGVYKYTYHMNAWEYLSLQENVGRVIEIRSTKQIAVLLEEFLEVGDCNSMIVAPTDNALNSSIPLFVSDYHYLQGYVNVWVSTNDKNNLLIDGKSYPWTRLMNETFIYETHLDPGYHVISSCNEESRLLVSVGGTFYAAYNMYTEIQKMCPFDRIFFTGVKLTFRATYPDHSSFSLETCPDSSSSTEKNLASRKCTNEGWEEPLLVECFTSSEDVSKEIEKLANTTVTEENVDEFSQDVALVTTQTEELTSSDIDNVADSLESIADTGSSSPEVTDSVVGTVNNIMQVDETTLENSEDSIKVVSSLEQQVSNVQQNPDNFTEVEDNVGVKAVKLNKNITKALTFLNLKSVEDNDEQTPTNSFSEDTTQLINNEREIRSENATASLYLPPKIFEIAIKADPDIQNVPISFFIYKDARLFQPTMKNDEKHSTYEIREEIASQVIAATLEMENVTIRNLSSEDSVVTRFQTFNLTEENENVLERRCVFWYVNDENNSAFWSQEGCTLETNSNNSMETACFCSHLTSFAVLFRIQTGPIDKSLTLITWIGSLLSIIGLVCCVITNIIFKNLRRKQLSKVHINLYVCLIGFYVTFLLGEVAVGNSTICKIVASAIHFFCLATVAWMCAEAVNMYFMFVKYRRTSIRNFLPISIFLAYGLPLIPTLIVFFLDQYEYQLDDYCFLHPGHPLTFGMLLEILLMVLFNIIVYALVIKRVVFRPMLSQKAKSDRRKETINRLQYLAMFWILLGLSWSFGFLILIPKRKSKTFEYLFCIFTSLQGVFLFLFVCLRNPEVRKGLKKVQSVKYIIAKRSSESKSSLKFSHTDSFSSLAYREAS